MKAAAVNMQINNQSDTGENSQARGLRVLLCDPAGAVNQPAGAGEERVASPLRCLDRATDRRPAIIVLRFGNLPVREQEALLELSALLKRNRHTRSIPVLALLPAKHRKLLENLRQAGVDFAHHAGEIALDAQQIRAIIAGLGPEDRLARQLATLCPFLHYNSIDPHHEMTVCGAYLDRMVLGGRRLREICGTGDHLRCEYYLNPRRSA
ncbi:MAG: hypothetical protein C4531_16240 [Desulfurivibrio sp.]|jgi:hypothetical protein|nr:MAG: hypothetical protein C4531_16240 [Desulfurivibrio sp.]